MSHPSSVWHVPIVEPVHSSSTVSPSWPAREAHVSYSSTAQSGGSIDSSTQSRLGSGVVRIGRGGARSSGRSEKQTSTTGEENTSGPNAHAHVKEANVSDSRESAQSESNEKNTNQRNQRRQRKDKQNNQNSNSTNDDVANSNSSHQSYSNNNNSSRQDRSDGNDSARMNGDNNRGRGGAGRGRGRGGRGGRMVRDNDPDGKLQDAFDLSSPPINSPSPSPRPDDAAHGEPPSSANRGRGGKRNRGRGNDNANKTNANPTNESISQTDSSTPALNDSTVPPPQTQSQQSSKPKPSRKERQVAAKARRDGNEATNATPNNDDNAASVATASTSSPHTSSSPSVLNIHAPSFVANSTLTPASSSTSRAKANDGSVSTCHPPKADRPQSSQSGSQTSRPNTNTNDAKSNSTSISWSDDPSNPVNIPSQPLVTELTQIARRYGSSYKQSQHRSTITCSFSFAPSDPDFPYALPPEKIVLQFVFADISLYPYTPLPQRSPTNESLIERLKRRIVVTCLNAEKDIPRFMRDVIERSITTFIHSTQLGQPQILRNTIKMVDKEILDWLILAQKKHNALIEKTIGKLTGVTAGGAQPTILATSASASSSSASSASISSSASSTAAATSDALAALPATSSSSVISSSSQLVPPSSSPSSSPSLPSASPSVPIPNNPLEPGFDDIEPEDIWTTEQQAALEHGLKTISRTLPAGERWDLIAKCVEGKTKKQVLARYKDIREKVRLEQLAAQQPNAQLSSVGASSSKLKQSSVGSSPAILASESHASNSSLSSSFSLLSLSNAREIDPDESARLHAQRILQQQLEREEEARQAAEEEEERKRELKANGGKMKKQPKKEKKKADSEDDAGEGGDEVKEFVPVTERLSLNPQHRGTQLILSGVEMTLGILKSHTIRLQLLCVRCESRVDMEFTPSNGQHNPCTERCQRCGIIMVLVYRPEMVHEHSDSLGYVDLENGEVFDMLPSDFFGTCLGCFSEYPIKQLQRGVKGEGNCRSCHTRLEWKVEQFEFERITPAKIDYDNGAKEDTRGKKAAAAIDPREVAAAKNRSKEQALLKLGTPLPNKGSCKHYKHSYRWMRFPCCGKAFPCQECHDAVEDHPGVWATRMICGACSKEQPFSSKPCSSCGLAFSTVAKTFWEGGQGMRDRTRLSRNDSHKHVGLGKTTSMKASRVGPKAKETNKPKSKGNNTS